MYKEKAQICRNVHSAKFVQNYSCLCIYRLDGSCTFIIFMLKHKKRRMHNILLNKRAGDGNRTHVISLEGWSSTIELHPLIVGVTGFEPATS